MNDNAYKVELPREYSDHATFNAGDLSPYLDDDGLTELRPISFKGGGDDTSLKGKASNSNPGVFDSN